MPTNTDTTPHYLELLNTIALAERRAGVFLQAWADKTPDAGLGACISLVAARETSHYDVFKRRIEELGYTLTEVEAPPDFAERLKVNGSDMPDIEKIRWGQAMRARQQQRPTVRERYEAAIADDSVDPLTRSLLRWFADEEADSGRLLADAYATVEAAAG